jgi:hypothetical protein
MRNAYQKGLNVLGVSLTVVMLAGLLALLVSGCSLHLAINRRLPRPPRHLTLEKAQRHQARLQTPRYFNRQYQPL